MRGRTATIFTIFIIIAVMGSFLIYFYRAEVDKMVKKYIAKITICGNILSEEDCYAKDFCEGIYGPTCSDCSDLEFRRCQRVSLKILAQLKQEKKRCQDTGGQWYRNKLGNFCLCQQNGINKTWDKKQGCINNS